MEKLIKYIQEALGQNISPKIFTKEQYGRFPFYISSLYQLYNAKLFDRELVFAKLLNDNIESINQIETHFRLMSNDIAENIVLLVYNIEAFKRKRLIEKGINFIIPGKQIYLPALLVDLKESYTGYKAKKNILTPSAQCILIHQILHRDENFEKKPLKEIAKMFNYSGTAISKAADNLKHIGLCTIQGTKEKFIHFNGEISELWKNALPLMESPIHKRVYVDEIPPKVYLKSYTSALPEYTDMNPSKQEYYAIEKNLFFTYLKENRLVNLNDFEGQYCLEVWKYDPVLLINNTEMNVVDPLSLYLSLKDNKDERIEAALEQIINKFIW